MFTDPETKEASYKRVNRRMLGYDSGKAKWTGYI